MEWWLAFLLTGSGGPATAVFYPRCNSFILPTALVLGFENEADGRLDNVLDLDSFHVLPATPMLSWVTAYAALAVSPVETRPPGLHTLILQAWNQSEN